MAIEVRDVQFGKAGVNLRPYRVDRVGSFKIFEGFDGILEMLGEHSAHVVIDFVIAGIGFERLSISPYGPIKTPAASIGVAKLIIRIDLPGIPTIRGFKPVHRGAQSPIMEQLKSHEVLHLAVPLAKVGPSAPSAENDDSQGAREGGGSASTPAPTAVVRRRVNEPHGDASLPPECESRNRKMQRDIEHVVNQH